MFTTPVVVAVVLYWSKNRNTEAELHPVMIIAEADFMDATTVISKEVNTAMNVNGRRKNVRRKRTKQLIAILLSITLITLATAKPYQEAKATGVLAGVGAVVASPTGILLIMGAVGVVSLAAPTIHDQIEDWKDLKDEGRKHTIEKAASRVADDFYNHTVQALNNNVSAAEQQRDNAAHARSVIDDFLESASAGVIDTTSEAWRWFQDFVSDIRNALGGGSSGNGVMVGKDLSGVYNGAAQFANGVVWGIEFAKFDVTKITDNDCFLAARIDDRGVHIILMEILASGAVREIPDSMVGNIGATYRWICEAGYDSGYVDSWETVPQVGAQGLCRFNAAIGTSLPLISGNVLPGIPSGTTDVPGVSNVNDYISIGSDLPYTRPEGAWDICDPNGKQGQVSIGADIPGKLGYDDWYDLLGGVATGDTTWEEVANASDVITIGSDLANDYSPSNAKDWSAYHDGTIVGYDVDAAGNVTITFEDGAVISIPQEYVSGMEWVNEQDKAQELDKDTALPVSGSLAYPLPAIQDPAVPADPQDPGGGSGDMKIDDDVKDYTLDFRKLFPFCIPFDIYKAVKLLDATPTAPVVHYKFYYKKSKSFTIDINLNKFNSVAAILRRMECLLFIIGLATATRRIYLRG